MSLSSSSNIRSSKNAVSLIYFDSTSPTSLSIFDDNNTLNNTFASFFLSTDPSILLSRNLSCAELQLNYITQKPLFNIVRYITQNLNRFFILPALVLNLCAFYILRRTRMNRSSSIAFYMQALALCDVAFFALRVIFGELSGSSTGRQILSTGLCKFLFLMVNAVNYTTVWLIAAMNADKFLAVCLPLRVSDLLSRKKAYAVVIAVIICSMLVASVHASRTVLKGSYCWLKTSQDEKLVFILDAFVWCFIPFVVISILNAAIFFALFRARREASHLHEATNSSLNIAASARTSANGQTATSNFLKAPTTSGAKSQVRTSTGNLTATAIATRNRIQSQNLQITIMLITISISFFVLTLPNAIYYLLIFLRVLIESWRAVDCDANLYRNLDVYVRTSAVMYLISSITSDLMHVVNFFLYFISGARFRAEFRRLIVYRICRWCCKERDSLTGKGSMPNERSFLRSSGVATVRSLASLPGAGIKQQRTSNLSSTTSTRDKQQSKQAMTRLSSNSNVALVGIVSDSLEGKTKRGQDVSPTLLMMTNKNNEAENDSLLTQE